MEESGYRFGVGVLVLASAIIGVLLIAFFGAVPAIWVDRYRASFNFPSAPKVTIDTPVRKNGVLIGRVSKIELLQGTGGVILTLELEKKNELLKSEVPRIMSGSFITGDAVVEFFAPSQSSLLKRFDGSMGTPANFELDEQERAAANEVITDGYYSTGGEVAKDPQDFLAKAEENFLPLMTDLTRTLARMDSLGASVQRIIGDEAGPINDLVSRTTTTLETINATAEQIKRVAGQVERADIPAAIANGLTLLPDLIKEAQSTLTQTQRTLKGFEQFSLSLEGLGKEFEGIGKTISTAVDNANVAIENIANITEPVSQNSERLVNGAVRALDDLNILAGDLKRLTARINNSNGTVSQLIDNPQLYITAQNTLRNIEQLTQKLQPILGDVRVATDKIARDPGGQLGVRGALSGRPQGLGLK
ncbi:MAG: MlaD family protein [Pirellula sp.]|nr:MlaD family protein [Pirellula sp.]MCY2977847.1 MlaD family protein [Planctomycetota bacterium]